MNHVRPILLATLLLLAGCTRPVAPGEGSVDMDDPEARFIKGIVVDTELVPIANVSVFDSTSETLALTDEGGRFVLGPVESGEHHLTAEKVGYAPVSVKVDVLDVSVEGIKILIQPIATSVPFYETTPYVTFVYCWIAFGSNVPCTKLPDYVAGTDVSSEEKFAFTFRIPYENLADILIEMTWNQQSLGRDMRFYIQTPPGQPLTAATQKYFRMIGSSPLRGWVVADVLNPGYGPNGTVVFDATPEKVLYEASTVSSNTNSTLPANSVAIFLNIRCETWMTYFYNRPGSREFSAIPDA